MIDQMMFSIILLLLALSQQRCVFSYVLSSKTHHHAPKKFRTTPKNAMMQDFSTALAQLVPREVGIEDKIATIAQTPVLVPDNSVISLDGGDNLGLLLWAFVLYNGLFAVSGRPADWIIPVMARVAGVNIDAIENNSGESTGNTNSPAQDAWYRDYKDGYAFECPPLVELYRFAFFVIIGYYADALVVAGFGGDSFWGWSIGACLAIPSALLGGAREKLPTRQEAELSVRLEADFAEFANERFEYITRDAMLGRSADDKYEDIKKQKSRMKKNGTDESRIILMFRRNSMLCRSEEEVPDKVLKRIIRKVIGNKPIEGRYPNINLPSSSQKGREANKRSLKLAAKLKEECEANEQCEVDESDCIDPDTCLVEGKEFIRT